MAKNLFIKTYGCQMNVYDSDRMAHTLATHGYRVVDAAADADIVVLNTCHIREKAAEKVYSELGRLRRLREARRSQDGRDLVLAVAGCVAQAEGDLIVERAPYVDIVVGPQAYHRLPELLARRARAEGAVVDTEFPVESKFDRLDPDQPARGVSAFLTIQEGCDKFCTFCVVPYTRGAEQSRPVTDIVCEAAGLVASGARELVLLGQNVNAYHGDGPDGRTWRLGRLLQRLAELQGVQRLRYTTSHPVDMDPDLIRAHGELPQLMPFLHLPVQSGSDVVLAAMNRGYTRDDYRRVIADLREARSDLALSSDFIVGFPGESDADFAATMSLVEETGFAQAFSFKYSPRPGTPASSLRRQVADTVKAERLRMLQEVLERQSTAFNVASVGTTMPVLLERAGRHPDQLVGRSPYLQAVHLPAGNLAIGDLVDARITACHTHSLAGTLLPEAPNQKELRA